MKPLWPVRNVHKLFNWLTISVSFFMLAYSVLNIFFLENNILYRIHLFSSRTTTRSRILLLILPVISIIFACTLFFMSNIPKKLKYEVNERTRQTALMDIKNYREFVIGTNFLITLCIFFMQLDALNIAKNFQGFGLIPSAFLLILLIPFSLHKFFKMKRIYEI